MANTRHFYNAYMKINAKKLNLFALNISGANMKSALRNIHFTAKIKIQKRSGVGNFYFYFNLIFFFFFFFFY